MHSDIVDLREFYLSGLGVTVRRMLRARIRQIWPNLRGERLLMLGYGTPYLRPFFSETEMSMAFMPAAQGVAYWPREGPNVSVLADMKDLPLPDNSIDRVVLVHALEGSTETNALLREVWRVLKSNGRMLVIVPNRRGMWAHHDSNPFGNGEPFSSGQIRGTLRDQGFLSDRSWRALYFPPSQSRFVLSIADVIEKYGEKLFPSFGGLHLVEAGKQLFAAAKPARRPLSQRLILPLPIPGSPTPFPAGRSRL